MLSAAKPDLCIQNHSCSHEPQHQCDLPCISHSFVLRTCASSVKRFFSEAAQKKERFMLHDNIKNAKHT